MKKIISAVGVLAIAGAALAFTSNKTLFQVLECDPSTTTCQELTVNAVGVGPQIEGNETFTQSSVDQPCAGLCDQTIQVQVEH